MHCVSKRIENGCDVSIYIMAMMPDIGHGNGYIFRKRSISVNPDSLGVFAKVTSACQAISTAAANDMTLCANHIPGKEVPHIGSCLHYLSNKFVADNHRYRDCFLSPCVP